MIPPGGDGREQCGNVLEIMVRGPSWGVWPGKGTAPTPTSQGLSLAPAPSSGPPPSALPVGFSPMGRASDLAWVEDMVGPVGRSGESQARAQGHPGAALPTPHLVDQGEFLHQAWLQNFSDLIKVNLQLLKCH